MKDHVILLYRQVWEAEEVSDPIFWSELMDQVLRNEDVSQLRQRMRPPASPQESELFDEYFEDYKNLKQMFLQHRKGGFDFNWKKPDLIWQTAIDSAPIIGDYALWSLSTYASEIIMAFATKPRTEAERLNDHGWELQQSGQLVQAIEYHDKAIAQSPRFCLAWINKGIAHKNLGQLEQSIACYDHVIYEVDSGYRKAWHNKAVALVRKVELSGSVDVRTLQHALECLEQALKIDPMYELALSLRSRINTALGYEG